MNMNKSSITISETNYFSQFFIDYIEGNKNLKEFYSLSPVIENVDSAIKHNKYKDQNRRVLVDSLLKQYDSIEDNIAVCKNIELLKLSNTFTITTGHQLNIATGPMYVILKLITAINSAEVLSLKYPDQNFVPIYWMATEDHDFEEINHFNVFGKTHTWNTNQTGAVGRFEIEKLAEMFPDLTEIPDLIHNAYKEGITLTEATRKFVHALLGKYGLICLDADQKELKELFKPIIKDELINRNSENLVLDSIANLKTLGYKNQVNPRKINLFYLEGNIRERIEYQEDKFVVLNTNISYSEEEILELLAKNPERFSPNVVLRPLYQCEILPDIITIGGPSEVVYWLQLKSMFDFYKVNFPILLPRNFALIVSQTQKSKLDKIGIKINDLFLNETDLKKLMLTIVDVENFNLNDELALVLQIQSKLMQKVNIVDPSLTGSVGAEINKMTKIIEDLDKKIQKSLERKHETSINQILNIKNKLFPNNSLQERNDNFYNFYANNDQFIHELKEVLDPFDLIFNIID